MSSCTGLIRLLTERYNLVDMIIKSNNGKAFTKSLISKIPYWTDMLKMAGSGYRRFARSRLYEYILVVMRFYFCI